MNKAISSIIVFTFFAKICGFFREILLSYFFGATGISDAYLISQTIPGTIFQFVGTGLTTCFIPVYYKILNECGKKNADTFIRKIISLVFVFSLFVIIIVWMFAPQLVKLFASGFKGDTLYYAINFTRIGILSLFFSSVIYVYNSYLQANSIFEPTAFAAIPNSLFIMFSIVLGAKYDLWLLSIGSTLAVGFQMLFLICPIKKLDFKFGINFQWRDPYIKKFLSLMIPVIIGVSVNEINILVDRTIASQVTAGGISALTYANSLIMFVQGGLVQPCTMVFYPQITAAVSKGNQTRAKEMVEEAISLLLSILIPVSVFFLIFCKTITQLIFGRGAFDKYATDLTAMAVALYAIGICFVALKEIVSRYFYAHGNTNVPMKNATMGVLLNIVLNLVFSRLVGIGGLALATSLSAVVSSFLLWKKSKKYISNGKINIDIHQLVKILIATIVMGVASLGLFHILPLRLELNFILTVTSGILIYFFVAYMLKVELMVKVAYYILKKL